MVTPIKSRRLLKGLNQGGSRAAVAIIAILLGGTAHAQGFTSTPISTGQVPSNNASISLAVNTVNGLSYCAYTIGWPTAGEVFYGTRPEGGSRPTEDTQVYASEVSLTTTQFTQGNVVPHLALTDFYKPGPPVVEGHLMWATRSTGGAWTYEPVESGVTLDDGKIAGSPSITLDVSKAPRIAYELTAGTSGGRDYLKLAKRVGPNSWTTEIVDSIGDSYDNITLRMASSEVVTYTRFRASVGTYEFLYAYRSGGAWVTEEIEPTASNPQNGAMTMPSSGLALVAYLTPTDGMLNYAYRLGANNWVKTKLRPMLVQNVHRGIDIISGSGNYPHIAYYSVNGDSVRYASLKQGGWNFQRVAALSNNWGPLSIGVRPANPNRPKIAYMGSDGPSGIDQYDLADGNEAFHGNTSALPAMDPDGAPASGSESVRTGVVVRGRSYGTGGPVLLGIVHPVGEDVELALLDIGGRIVARRSPEWLDAGSRELAWEVGALPSGMYFVRMKTGTGALAHTKLVIAH